MFLCILTQQYLSAVPVSCDGGHCLLTSLLIFQLSQEFPGLVEMEQANILTFFCHDFCRSFIQNSTNSQDDAHLPSSDVRLHHGGGALDLLVFLLLLCRGKKEVNNTKSIAALCDFACISLKRLTANLRYHADTTI